MCRAEEKRGREGAGFDSGRARECKLQRGESTVGGWLGRVGARGKSFTRLDPGSGEGKGGLEVRAPPAPSGRVSCNRIHCIQGLQKQASCCLLLQDEQRLQGRKLPYLEKFLRSGFIYPRLGNPRHTQIIRVAACEPGLIAVHCNARAPYAERARCALLTTPTAPA